MLLRSPLAGLGRSMTPTEVVSIDNYMNLLIKWQKSQRLVSSTDREWLVENVITDSVLFFGPLPPTARRVADVGSGAGIPGIPMAIVRPDLDFTLIEARLRRVSFLSTCIRELGLSNTIVVASRVEDIAQGQVDAFDSVVMRCAGRVSRLIPHVMRLLTPDGLAIASGPPDDRQDEGAIGIHVERASGPPRRFRIWRRSNYQD